MVAVPSVFGASVFARSTLSIFAGIGSGCSLCAKARSANRQNAMTKAIVESSEAKNEAKSGEAKNGEVNIVIAKFGVLVVSFIFEIYKFIKILKTWEFGSTNVYMGLEMP
jgi:hypothetical protein